MIRFLLIGAGFLLAGCSVAPTGTTTPPDGARPGLDAKWFAADGYKWPANDGFSKDPVYVVLEPGMLLDRFGSEGGRFFSPKGAAFGARALPTVCAELVYSVYQVQRPLPVRIGAAAPWFDEQGGATQLMTDATAAQLVSDQTLRRMPQADAPCPS